MVNSTEAEEVYGIITGHKFDKGSMSAPAFMDMDILVDNPETMEMETIHVFAQGKLAKSLVGVVGYGLHVTITLQGSAIVTFESYE